MPITPAIIGDARNLVAKQSPSAPTRKVKVTADELIVKDGVTPMLLSSVQITPDVTVSGANGLDAGAVAPSTWYYVWVIAKANGSSAGLLSRSPTGPVMPAGYSYSALVSAVRTDLMSRFVAYRQLGRTAYFELGVLPGTQNATGSEQMVDLSPYVPKIASVIRLGIRNLYAIAQAIPNFTGVDINLYIRFVSGVNASSTRLLGYTAAGNRCNDGGSGIDIPNLSQRVYYQLDVHAGTGAQVDIGVLGFVLP